MKKIILIICTIILVLIAFLFVFLIRVDITKDDINAILADTVTIDICRNMDQDNDKLTDCGDENNALVKTLTKDDEMFNSIIEMYTGSREKNRFNDSFLSTLKAKANWFYKVVFKDEKGNALMGSTLGCTQSFFKIDDTYYNLHPGDNCGSGYKDVWKYLEDHDSSHEEYYNKFLDKLANY